ncbi:lipocalin family protein [Rhodococcoides corynebacterioides]|uniref:lipocalin family protein n=1 Tax=Rhodococcoides corynebacterioides TaxID=53972 RepID=UPI00082DAFD9|nr:lipocalin family protein [Rhodococcus corynebacterioides]MBY6349552.1 lipocalin family protein [Rhodococcus corynebacterioides]MBY6362540.1 lipocalin family protein [Rhodococcus corynebacterioides]
MKRTFARAAAALALATGAALAGSGAASAQPLWEPLQPIQKLDIERYTGDWWQLAAVPQPFNLNCAKDTKANYQLLDPANVRVQNTCTRWDGGRNEILGNARVNDPVTQAQLHVSFPGVPTQDNPDGPTNYIVTYIADDYSWALVGDPFRTSGFVLSRSPQVSTEKWQEIRRVVESRGYNACLVLTSPTTEGSNEIRPLCTV